MSFLNWSIETPEELSGKLRSYILKTATNWVGVDSQNDAENVIKDDSTLDDSEKQQLDIHIQNAWKKYDQHVSNKSLKKSIGQLFWDNVSNIALLSISLLVFIIIAYGLIGTAGILDRISSTDTARGLITFVFAFGVMSIAFMLILSLFIVKGPEVTDKFQSAKEVFTALIAILGTIMGFYFGVEVQGSATENEEVILSEMEDLGIQVSEFNLTDLERTAVAALLSSNLTDVQKKQLIEKVLQRVTNPAVTPEPSPNPAVTPEPSSNPAVTPEPSPNPAVTPEPPSNPAVTPEPSSNPAVTPEPSSNPAVTPEPSPNPAVTPEPPSNQTPTQ